MKRARIRVRSVSIGATAVKAWAMSPCSWLASSRNQSTGFSVAPRISVSSSSDSNGVLRYSLVPNSKPPRSSSREIVR